MLIDAMFFGSFVYVTFLEGVALVGNLVYVIVLYVFIVPVVDAGFFLNVICWYILVVMFIVGDFAKVVLFVVSVVLVEGFAEGFLLKAFAKVLLVRTILSGIFWNVVLDGRVAFKSVCAC